MCSTSTIQGVRNFNQHNVNPLAYSINRADWHVGDFQPGQHSPTPANRFAALPLLPNQPYAAADRPAPLSPSVQLSRLVATLPTPCPTRQSAGLLGVGFQQFVAIKENFATSATSCQRCALWRRWMAVAATAATTIAGVAASARMAFRKILRNVTPHDLGNRSRKTREGYG